MEIALDPALIHRDRPTIPCVQFSVLGPLEVTDGRGPVALGSPKQRRLLAALLVRTGETVSVDALVEAIWSQSPPRSAAKTLQGYVVHLRQALSTSAQHGEPGAVIVTMPSGYRLDLVAHALDSVRFTSLVGKGRHAVATREWSAARVFLEEGLALWRGPAYPEFAGSDFAAAEAARLAELRRVALETRFDVDLALGEDAALVPELEMALAGEPVRERLWELLIRALYRAGRQSDALAAYVRARDVLADELGVDPGPGLQAVQAAVLAQDPALDDPARGVANVGVLSSRQPTAGVYAFDGREADLAWLRAQWLRAIDEGGRIAVVSGPSGLGKTRLLAAFADDVQRSNCVVIRRTGLTAPNPGTIAAVAAGRPVLVALDDPRTGLDPRSLADFPVLVVAGVDPTRAPAHVLRSLASAQWRELDPLPDAVCARITRRWVADDSDGIDIEAILRDAHGNPAQLHRLLADVLNQRSRVRIDTSVTELRSAGADVRALRSQLAHGVRGLRRGRALYASMPSAGLAAIDSQCPYRGLESYRADDAAVFHGRDAVIEQLVGKVADTPVVAVVGASGSGKSSVVRAGLLVALSDGCLPGSGSWQQFVTTPADPLPVPGAAPAVVVVDQFEQAWTVHDDGHRRRYLDSIIALSDAGHRVVLTLRADHVERCSEHERLREAVADGAVLLGPMSAAELSQVITGPAEVAGCGVEPGLVDRILIDVRGLHAPLPMLSTALVDTWEGGAGAALTVDSYVRSGGVAGALARRAEAVFAALDVQEQQAARRIFLRLASGERGRLVRRSCPYAEAAHDEPARRAIDALAAARLITVDAASVEVAHEALFDNWPRLSGWLDDDEQGRRLRAHLAPAALDWDQAARSEADLYRGLRLHAVLDWMTERPADLNPVERDFIAASVALADRELRAERTRASKEARARRRLRSLLAATTVTAVLTIAATVVALAQRQAADRQRHVADEQRQTATEQARIAVARQLGAAALDNQPLDHSLLLAASAVRMDDNATTRSDLLAALQRSPAAQSVWEGDGQSLIRLALTDNDRIAVATAGNGNLLTWNLTGPRTAGSTEQFAWSTPSLLAVRPGTDEVVLAGISDGTVGTPEIKLWDTRRRQQVGRDLPGATSLVESLAWSADGRWLAAAQQAGDVLVWDLDHPGRPALPVKGHDSPGRLVAYAGKNRFVVVEQSGGATIWSLGSRRPVRRFLVGANVTAVATDASGTRLAVGHQSGSAGLWRLPTGDRVDALTGHSAAVPGLAFSADGHLIASLGADNDVNLSDSTTGRLLGRFAGHTDVVTSASFTADNRTLYTTSVDGQMIGWDIADLDGLGGRLSAPGTPGITSMAVSRTGDIATEHTDGSVRFWPGGGNGASSPLHVTDSALISGAFSPDGRSFATAEASGTSHLIDVASRRVIGILAAHLPAAATGVAFSPDGRKAIVLVDDDEHAYVFDTATRRAIGDPLVGGTKSTDVIWSQDSRYIAIMDHYSDEIRVFELSSGIVVWYQDTDVDVIAWSPDGATIASGDTAGRIHLWRSADGAPIGGGWRDHARFTSLAYSPDGSMLASGGYDGTVVLRDVATGDQIGPPLKAMYNQRTIVRFDPTGDLIVATGDGGLWRWNVDVTSLLHRACTIAGRNLTAQEWAALHTGRPYLAACP